MTKATDRRKSAVKGLTSAILEEFFGQPPLFSASCIFPSYLSMCLLVSCFFSFLPSKVCLFSSSSLLVHLRSCSTDRFGTTSIGFLPTDDGQRRRFRDYYEAVCSYVISKPSLVLIVENFENFRRTCRDISFFLSWKYKGKSNFETEIFENMASRIGIGTNPVDRVN